MSSDELPRAPAARMADLSDAVEALYADDEDPLLSAFEDAHDIVPHHSSRPI